MKPSPYYLEKQYERAGFVAICDLLREKGVEDWPAFCAWYRAYDSGFDLGSLRSRGRLSWYIDHYLKGGGK